MSVFMCSDDHLKVLALAWARPDGGRVEVNAEAKYALKVLFEANAKSLVDRYGDKLDELVPEFSDGDWGRLHARCSDAVTVIKLTHSYAYQACEWKEWEGSKAEKIARETMEKITWKLPGMDEAPWSI